MNIWKHLSSAGTAIITCIMVVSCASTSYTMYRQGLFDGGQFLRNGDIQSALPQFLKANQGDPTQPLPLALAGQVTYQMGDVAKASQYLTQASALNPMVQGYGYSYVIIKGYQALIAFREKQHQEGMAALGEYVRVYNDTYPDSTYGELTNMYHSGNISISALELLINHQMSRYEDELFEFF
jgi:tetratricopeptide (TPR) repeat protein